LRDATAELLTRFLNSVAKPRGHFSSIVWPENYRNWTKTALCTP